MSSPSPEISPMPEVNATADGAHETETNQNAATSAPSSQYMAKPTDSYTKLAMRNMVRRGGTSLFHFALTIAAVLGILVGLSVVFH